ncbi:MAG: glutamine-hydrolyzing carbamoyl-phosphate synthase small subunit [Coxiellaceae bacterium]|nr:glutamine-hydrolyzing carbamoyl-phosphate synthase small subunit [Coxiellaceae bacterium]
MNTEIDDLLNPQPAKLFLAGGEVFNGVSLGVSGYSVGEVVFNTAMTGYQEILTDPSYAEQLITLTYPHIGNVGVNEADAESNRIWAKGLIIRDESPLVSSWRAESSLRAMLQQQGIVAIAGVDTRRLTRLIRDQGAVPGCIVAGDINEAKALEMAQQFAGLKGADLASQVTTEEIYRWGKGTYVFPGESEKVNSAQHHVVVYDFGVKRQMLRLLVDRGCQVTVVPAKTSAEEVMAYAPDGVLLSNGPGDPAACGYAVDAIKELLQQQVPMFGICLGYQLLSLALGASTKKMKFGHHGANHPVKKESTGQVMITSQNHGFAVDEDSLPAELTVTHRSLFDGTLQGIAHQKLPVFGFQGHPEASPGPQDIEELFDQFVSLMGQCQQSAKVESTHA